jgi:hypothetical protein
MSNEETKLGPPDPTRLSPPDRTRQGTQAPSTVESPAGADEQAPRSQVATQEPEPVEPTSPATTAPPPSRPPTPPAEPPSRPSVKGGRVSP